MRWPCASFQPMKMLLILSALSLVQVVCTHAADSIYSISLKDIDGKSTSLKAYEEKSC